MTLNNSNSLEAAEKRIEELEEALAVVAGCDGCGDSIRFGNACVEFVRMVGQMEGADVVQPIDIEVVALFCAGCGNRFSDPEHLREKLAVLVGVNANYVAGDDRAELEASEEHCDSCRCQIHSGGRRVDVDLRVTQLDHDGDGGVISSPIRADGLIVLCVECGNRCGREKIRTAVNEMADLLRGAPPARV